MSKRSLPVEDTEQRTEWFKDSPKLHLHNALQKLQSSIEPYKTFVEVAEGFECHISSHHILGNISATGKSKKDAFDACALIGCRVLHKKGLLFAQKKFKVKDSNKEVLKRSPHPFAVSFDSPLMNGGYPAKSRNGKLVCDGYVLNIDITSSQLAIKRALSTSWARDAPINSPIRRYSSFHKSESGPTPPAAPSSSASDVPFLPTPKNSVWGSSFARHGSIKDQWQNRQKKMLSNLGERQLLPVYQQSEEIIRLTNTHDILVLGAETGSGKTTQVAQLIADELLETLCSLEMDDEPTMIEIIVTQPRRVAAVSLAHRVAFERGEEVGDSVGYQVRLECCNATAPIRITYCTTGVLLRRLLVDPCLSGVHSVILDEVHERDLESDILITLFKRLQFKQNQTPASADASASPPRLPIPPPSLLRESNACSPRVILMSATFNADLFVDYFSNDLTPSRVGVLKVQGRMFPVQEIYLEEAIIAAGIDLTQFPVASQSLGQRFRKNDELKLIESEMLKNGVSHELISELKRTSCLDDEVSPQLVSKVVYWLCSTPPIMNPTSGVSTFGTILVFLPGVGEITAVQEALASLLPVSNSITILPLHGALSVPEQQRVFSLLPAGSRKVILATNIAESSITIKDAVYVVSSGKVKEQRYYHESGVSALQSRWCSLASCTQRRGRAGRVSPGFCIHLFAKPRLKYLHQFPIPEICCSSLEEVCLNIRALPAFSDDNIAGILATCPEPPKLEVVSSAVNSLMQLGALCEGEVLTRLGQQLIKLPVSPRIGKMLIFGHFFGCSAPMLTIAASLSCRDAFIQTPRSMRAQIDARKRILAGPVALSDHWLLVEVYNQWQASILNHQESQFIQDNFLSLYILRNIEATRIQLARKLKESFRMADNQDSEFRNQHGSNVSLVKALVTACFSDQVAKVVSFKANPHGLTSSSTCSSLGRLCLQSWNNCGLRIHPSSCLGEVSHQAAHKTKWAVYHSKIQTSELFLDTVSLVSPVTLLLFGPKLECYHFPDGERVSECGIVQSNWRTHTMAVQHALSLNLINIAIKTAIEDFLMTQIGEAGVLDLSELSKFVDSIVDIVDDGNQVVTIE